MNKHKKFIREALEGKLGLEMCQDWKNKILEHYPEFENKKLEIGRWYKNNRFNIIIHICKPKGREVKGFGIDATEIYPKWFDNREANSYWGYMHEVHDWEPMTDKEVEQHLIKEAERRGFMIGHIVKSAGGLKGEIVNGYPHEYRSMNDSFYYHNMCVYKRGQWAEILTITKEQAEKKLKCKILD